VNKKKPIQSYLWLVLAGIGGQATGQASLVLTQNDVADFISGFSMGLSVVALGAFIYLASRLSENLVSSAFFTAKKPRTQRKPENLGALCVFAVQIESTGVSNYALRQAASQQIKGSAQK
jgi:hypothetical protein